MRSLVPEGPESASVSISIVSALDHNPVLTIGIGGPLAGTAEKGVVLSYFPAAVFEHKPRRQHEVGKANPSQA